MYLGPVSDHRPFSPSKAGYAAQDDALYAGSLAENIAFFDPEIEMDRVDNPQAQKWKMVGMDLDTGKSHGANAAKSGGGFSYSTDGNTYRFEPAP
ncbi:MAG: hypothetical protein ACFBQW_01935 [Sphingomonadaceae bacterium]